MHVSVPSKKRLRSPRVAPLELPPGTLEKLWMKLSQADVLLRLGLCLAAIMAIIVTTHAWVPPLSYRLGTVPARNLTAIVAFSEPNPAALEAARRRAAIQAPAVYRQEPKELELLRAALQNAVTEVVNAPSYDEANREIWRQFYSPPASAQRASAAPAEATTAVAQAPRPSSAQNELANRDDLADRGSVDESTSQAASAPNDDEQPAEPTDPAAIQAALERQSFEAFRTAMRGETGLAQFGEAVQQAFAPYEHHGLLDKLPEEHGEGNQKEIVVYQNDSPGETHVVQVSDVLIGDADALRRRLAELLPSPLAEDAFHWLRPRLKPTLRFDAQLTQQAREAAAAAVSPASTDSLVEAGQVLAVAGKPLNAENLRRLELEHRTLLGQQTPLDKATRAMAVFGLLLSIFALCGYYIYFRAPQLTGDWRRLGTLLVYATGTVAVMPWTAADPSRTELIPLLVFAMTFAIAYSRDVSLVLSLAVAGTMVVVGGLGLGDFFILFAAVTSSVAQLGRIRSRSKLIRVGAIAAVVTFAATVMVGLLEQQPLSADFLMNAGRNALWTFLAGFLVTGLLPLIESVFGVLTEISLLEWSDVSHPLLQELVRRAPGTYNHSINVASLAEAAAESVGARGLLVRVGAYFHDIGKVLKPDYFAENQTFGSNRHDHLMPAMSTLIIIAHVKDGADLARQHDLPEPITQFIEQHHGTTLVEYFYHRASAQRDADPNAAEVLESSYRYPGPKPQTIEAAVLMLADAVESASRTLVEPTPSRLEGLVESIAMKRLLDGQFDECHLTLEQLHTIQHSLAKSLTAVYHGRVKYPKSQTA